MLSYLKALYCYHKHDDDCMTMQGDVQVNVEFLMMNY